MSASPAAELARAFADRRRGRRRAFTLAELLVVIGIVGLLAALLLPALSAVRGRANLASCLSNQRQIGQAGQTRALDHDGFLPPDGELTIPDGTFGLGSLPPALRDPSRERYRYFYDPAYPSYLPTIELPVPFSIDLIAHMSGLGLGGAIVPDYRWSVMEQKVREAELFRCPSARPMRTGAWYPGWQDGVFEGAPSVYVSLDGLMYGTTWYVNVDYATNAGVVGFHYDLAFEHRRKAGHLTRVAEASRVVLLGDTAGWESVWIPALTPPDVEPQPVTLRDVLQQSINVHPTSSPLDLRRHDGRMNVLYVDGHAEGVEQTVPNLSRALLTLE